MRDLSSLFKTIQILRQKDEWTSQQTIFSDENKFEEEFNEVLNAIHNNDYDNLQEELGDLLFHIVLMIVICEEQNIFSYDDVLNGIVRKMFERHLPNEDINDVIGIT